MRRMVEFLYTGDYDASSQQNTVADTTKASKPASIFDFFRDEPSAALEVDSSAVGNSSHGILPPAAGDDDAVLQHVRVSVIADYYDINDLAKLANSKIQSSQGQRCNPQALADAVMAASDLTRDGDLQETMAALAAQNLNNLLDSSRLDNLVSDFGLKIIRKYVQKAEAIENELREKTTQLSHSIAREEAARDAVDRAAVRTARTHENISQCLQTLRERDQCRNHKCFAPFNCYIEERGHQPVYTIRCSKCRCRH